MTDHEFVFWLRGFLFYSDIVELNEEQVSRIKKYLARLDILSTPIKKDLHERPIDKAIAGCQDEYNEVIELYKTYGGD